MGQIRKEDESIAHYGVEISQEENTILTSEEDSLLRLRELKGRWRKSHRTQLIDDNQFNKGLMGSEHLPKFWNFPVYCVITQKAGHLFLRSGPCHLANSVLS